MLDDEELRVASGRRLAARVAYAHAHAALRRVLAVHYLGGPPGAIRYGRHPCPRCGDRTHGRPRITSHTTNLEFSLSRSGPHWAVAVTTGGSVGLDIESRDTLHVDGASGLVLSDPEREQVRTAEHEEARRDLFLRVWTRKEAVLKAVGTGIVANLRELDVRLDESGPVRVEHTERGRRSRRLVEEPVLDPGLAVALAREDGHPGHFVVRSVGVDTAAAGRTLQPTPPERLRPR